MDFELSDEHKMIRDLARQIAKEHIAPRVLELAETDRYPEDIYQIYKENGLLGLVFPEEYGGSGAGTLGLCLAIEEMCKHDNACGLMLLLTRLSTVDIMVDGTEAQKQKYCRGVATGQLRGSFALTEPSAGSDAVAIRARAQRKGDEYILNGHKVFISGATVADFYTVAAKTDPTAGHRGISVLIVDRDSPGFAVGRPDRKMGVTAVPTAELIMEDCRVPAQNLVGRENEGFRTLMQGLNAMRPIVGARGLGLAEGALQYAVEYSKNRQAFGQPICNFQGLQFMMADMAMRIEAARWLVYYGAWLADQGKFTREHAGFLSMSKCYPTEIAEYVASNSLQILGAYGYMKEFPLEHHYRDAKQLQIVEGTSQIQRLIIAEALIRGDIKYY